MKALVSNNLANKIGRVNVCEMLTMDPKDAIHKYHIVIDVLEDVVIYSYNDDPMNLLGESNEDYQEWQI